MHRAVKIVSLGYENTNGDNIIVLYAVDGCIPAFFVEVVVEILAD
jgi:hypothetical protein